MRCASGANGVVQRERRKRLLGESARDLRLEELLDAVLSRARQHLIVVQEQPASVVTVHVEHVTVHRAPHVDAALEIEVEPAQVRGAAALVDHAVRRRGGFAEHDEEARVVEHFAPRRQRVAEARILEAEGPLRCERAHARDDLGPRREPSRRRQHREPALATRRGPLPRGSTDAISHSLIPLTSCASKKPFGFDSRPGYGSSPTKYPLPAIVPASMLVPLRPDPRTIAFFIEVLLRPSARRSARARVVVP
jgi:hypothetical protein